MKKIILTICLFSFIGINGALAQISACLQNGNVDGSDFTFDIYLKADQSAEEAYLSESDFVLEIDRSEFADLRFEKVDGYCDVTSLSQSEKENAMAQLQLQQNYYNGISVAVNGKELIINLQAPKPGDLAALSYLVAVFDDSEAHRIGRFRLSGLKSSVAPTLNWKQAGQGQYTKIHSFVKAKEGLPSELLSTTLCDNLKTMSETSPDLLIGANNLQISPNPVAKSMLIELEMETEGTATLNIRDVAGRLVATPLLNVELPTGMQVIPFETTDLGAGVYFCTLEVKGERLTKQFVVVK